MMSDTEKNMFELLGAIGIYPSENSCGFCGQSVPTKLLRATDYYEYGQELNKWVNANTPWGFADGLRGKEAPIERKERKD